MDTRCPICFRPYGKRRRCYYCTANQEKPPIACKKCGVVFTPRGARTLCYRCTSKPRTGETRTCTQCGDDFYVQRCFLEKGGGIFCSRPCKHAAMKGMIQPWAKPDEKTLHSAGYVLVWKPDHPRASRGRVFEHVIVMEEVLGRSLAPGEFVHHINRDKTDNRPENLQVVTNSEHGMIHGEEAADRRRKPKVTLMCQECGAEFLVPPNRACPKDPKNRRKYCSLACRHKAWSRQMDAYRPRKNSA